MKTARKFISTAMKVPHRGYEEALNTLNSAVPVSLIKTENMDNLRQERSGRSLNYLSAIGICEAKLKQMNVVHVAGSKGKGSTCAMVESVLRNMGFKTGFLSSPHLINVEERIRINGKPIDRNLFADTFWSVYDQVTSFTETSGIPKPGYLHYIILVACKAFIDLKVDAAIIEVGMGGRFDHTNFFSEPAVTVVTSLSLEHTPILGTTLAEIAWRKAGIFKPHCYAVVARGQPDEAMSVLEKESILTGCPLYVAPNVEDISVLSGQNLKQLITKHVPDLTAYRGLNIALSLAAVELWMRYRNGLQSDATGLQPPLQLTVSPTNASAALETIWPGRWHKVYQKNVIYFIDGAHTEESIQSIAEWFQTQSHRRNDGHIMRVLIFTVLGSRDPMPMLEHLRNIVRPGFDLVLFTNPHPRDAVYPPSKQSQHECCLRCWQSLMPQTPDSGALVSCLDDVTSFVDWLNESPGCWTRDRLIAFASGLAKNDAVREAVSCAGDLEKDSLNTFDECHVLVTGSLYLVGAALKALDEPV